MFIPRASFKLRNLFYNPENNLRLTEQTLVENLCLDLQALPEGESAATLVSYTLTERLARRIARTLVSNQLMMAYQFEIRLLPGLGEDRSEDTLLVSPIIKEVDHVS